MEPIFKLKVVRDESSRCFYSDTRHELGGTDMEQKMAFKHLFSEEYCTFGMQDILASLAAMHNWQIQVTLEIPEEEDSWKL